jgi:hypothetical protein
MIGLSPEAPAAHLRTGDGRGFMLGEDRPARISPEPGQRGRNFMVNKYSWPDRLRLTPAAFFPQRIGALH